MGVGSWWHWVVVLVVAALLFGGRGKLSGLMGDAAKGIKAFKEGLKDEDKGDDVEEVEATPLPKKTAPKAKSRG